METLKEIMQEMEFAINEIDNIIRNLQSKMPDGIQIGIIPLSKENKSVFPKGINFQFDVICHASLTSDRILSEIREEAKMLRVILNQNTYNQK